MEEAETPEEGFTWQDHLVEVQFNAGLAAWEATSPDWPELRVVDGEAYRAIVRLQLVIRDQWMTRHAAFVASSTDPQDPGPFRHRVTVRYNPTEAVYEAVSPDIPEMQATDQDPSVVKEKLREMVQLRLEHFRREGIEIPGGVIAILWPWPVVRRWLGGRIPDGQVGYTLEEALGSVGPGWSGLVAAVHHRVTNAAGLIVQVKEKFGGLRVYYYPPDTTMMADVPHRSLAALERWERWIERRSFTVCEGCGEHGGKTTRGGGWIRTLCATCAWRWREGAISWSEIRGEWSPDAPESD
jgi:hypothetical protein